jgi:transcription termination/antitermination protein NusG
VLWKTLLPSEDGEALRKMGDPWQSPGFLSETPQARSWFALYTVARHEKRVAQYLAMRDIEHYLPLYRSRRRWADGSRVTLDLPLFPGYIFVHIERSERGRVLAIGSALAMVVGTGGEPAALPDATIEALRSGINAHGVEPHPYLIAGQRVRICSGAFTGLEGIVVRCKSEYRVVLTLEHIARSFSVELGWENLEPIPANASSAKLPAFSLEYRAHTGASAPA